MQTISRTILPEEEGSTIRYILRARLGFSAHAVRSLTRRKGGILLNGQRAFASAHVRAGDVLTAAIGDIKAPDQKTVPCGIPLPIVYEDDYLLVADKPAGMAALSSSLRPDTPTVAGALAYQRGEASVFHVVNRLDSGTTGLMTVAKCGYVHNLLRNQLHSEAFYREYRGVCVGRPEPPSGTVDLPIGRADGSAVGRCVRADGAPSVSRYETLEQAGALTFLRLIPETGRTHQLRVHMAAIGCPLAGDWLYGREDPSLISRPALHSCLLRLRHPVTGEMLELSSPLPEDMKKLIETT